MSIPKTIHYCWFGNNPMPERYQKNIADWGRICEGYKIIEWNECNFNVESSEYCRSAYQDKDWAFISDYARLKIIYEEGGIYLDTDVKVLRNLDALIRDDIGFIGFQNPFEITTGLGFAAAPKNKLIKSILDIYDNYSNKLYFDNGKRIPCPVINTFVLQLYGLQTGMESAKRIQLLDGLNVYPEDYFDPLDENTMRINVTENTYTIHEYAASWYGQKELKLKRVIKRFMPKFLHDLRTQRIVRKHLQFLGSIISEVCDDE